MYFDSRLWEFTKGVRLRIAASAAIGLLAAVFGIARLAPTGRVFRLVRGRKHNGQSSVNAVSHLFDDIAGLSVI